MPHPPAIAVLGLGAMGQAFARNLLKQRFEVTVWNRTRARADVLAQAGAQVAATPAAAVAQAHVVISMLPDAAATSAVLFGDDGAVAALAEGAIVVQMGTIGLAQTEQLRERIAAARADVRYVDAPVSGTKAPAEQGQVTVLASGGDESTRTTLTPVFDAIGSRTHWLGEAGAGMRMKLVVNTWLASLLQGAAESARLAELLGFSTDQLWNVLDGGPLAAPLAKLKLRAIGAGDFSPQFGLALALKDARLALDAADELPMPVLRQIAQSWDAAVQAGAGKDDVVGIYRYLGPR